MRLLLALAIAAALVLPAAGAELPQPAAGVWRLRGTSVVRACAGRCASQREPIDREVLIEADDAPVGVAPVCDGVSSDDVQRVLTVQPGRRGWYRLRVLDRDGLGALLATCIGNGFRFGALTGKIRVGPDGRSIEQVMRLGGQLRDAGRTVRVRATTKLRADWLRPAP